MKTPHGEMPEFELEGVDPLSLRVSQAFRRAMMLYRHLMMRTLGEKGLHPGQAACLGMLSTREGMSQRALAEMLHVSAPTVTTMLQRMERAGMVERKADPDDQRATRIYLTEDGRCSFADQRKALAALVNSTIGTLSEADRIDLERILSILSENTARALDESGPDHVGHDTKTRG